MTKNIDLLRREEHSPVDAFDIPYDVVKLPSKGLLYPENHPLCGETEIPFKPMTAMHENILASKALIKKGTVIPTLIKSCLLNQAIDPGSLLLGDKSAIMLAIRISGFGAEYRVSTRCPSCEAEWNHTFDLSKVELKMLEHDPVKPNTNLFEFILPSDKKTSIQFSLLTDADEMDIFNAQNQKKKAMSKMGVSNAALEIDTVMTDQTHKMIKSINGKTDGEYISSFIRNMRVMDSRAFRKYVADVMPDLIMEQSVECISCGEKDDHKIMLSTEFFWPKLES